jgi:hypothetical protein
MVAHSTDVLDNTVSGVVAIAGGGGGAYGIVVQSAAADVRINGNRVRNLSPDGSGPTRGIYVQAPGHSTIRGNDLVGSGNLLDVGSVGIACVASGNQARDNIVDGFSTGISTCSTDTSNHLGP